MINLQRQVAGLLAEGETFAVQDATSFSYKVFDVLPKIVLKLEEGKYVQNSFLLEDGDEYDVQLPDDYDSANRLAVTIRSNAIIKVEAILSPTTHTFLLKGTDTSSNGDHPGVLMFQQSLDELTISNPTGNVDAFIEYFIYEIPDLDSPSSYRTGNMAFGYVVEEE